MIKIIIPSKDRAAQADLLIRSLRDNWTFNGLKIFVLFLASSDEFYEGYCRLKSNYRRDPIVFIDEVNFPLQVKQLVIPSHKCNYTAFCCDDGIVYKKCDVLPKEFDLFMEPDVLCWQARLSVNTYVQNYVNGEIQPTRLTQLSHSYVYDNKLLRWNYKQHPRFANYGYLYNTDLSVYHSEWIYNNIKDREFTIYRAIEHQINVDDLIRQSAPKYMLCSASESVFFANSVNAVQDNNIPCGSRVYYDPRELNDRFLAGEQIALQPFGLLSMNASHGEVEYSFERSEK